MDNLVIGRRLLVRLFAEFISECCNQTLHLCLAKADGAALQGLFKIEGFLLIRKARDVFNRRGSDGDVWAVPSVRRRQDGLCRKIGGKKCGRAEP